MHWVCRWFRGGSEPWGEGMQAAVEDGRVEDVVVTQLAPSQRFTVG